MAEFSFSYREAGKYGFSNGTFFKVIQDLMKFGFIDPIDKGGLRGESRSSSIFKLSERWKDYSKNDFEVISWKRFEPKL